jgi:hypothetical protein
MRRIDQYVGTLFLAAAIVAPVLVVAEAKAQEASVQVRVYDQATMIITTGTIVRIAPTGITWS